MIARLNSQMLETPFLRIVHKYSSCVLIWLAVVGGDRKTDNVDKKTS